MAMVSPTAPATTRPYRSRSKGRDEWNHVEDAKERKRIQNRLAQRSYRERMKRRIEALEQIQNSSQVCPQSPTLHGSNSRSSTTIQITAEDSLLSLDTYQPVPGYPTPVASSDDEQSYISSPSHVKQNSANVTASLETGYVFENLCYEYPKGGESRSRNVPWDFKVDPENALGVTALSDDQSFVNQFTCTERTALSSSENISSNNTRNSTPESSLEDGKTALHIAAENGQQMSVQVLAEMGCNVHARDSSGYSALHMAVENQHHTVAQELLRHSADVNAQASNGQTPLHKAVLGGDERMVMILLSAGAKIEAKENSGRSPLHIAALKGHEAVLKLLIERGADVNAKTGG